MKAYAASIGLISLAGCAVTPAAYDYSSFRSENPRSILVVPALNQSVNVAAAENFLSTIAPPFANRGYYVFPSYMVRKTMESDGLADAGLVHQAPATRLGELFGCDAALYVTIERWQSQTIILSTSTTVDLNYELKSCKTGTTLWVNRRTLTYSPQASSSGNPLADLVAQAAVSLIEKSAPSYMPLARQANLLASSTAGQGLPAGPYLPEQYGRDVKD
jgi:hypothetical protein